MAKKLSKEEAFVTVGGTEMPKSERYNWSKIGKPGKFRQVPKEDVLVDHEYQRNNVSMTRVRSIASDFSWQAFGVLLCVEREDGSIWTYDGQHRKLGADKRVEIKTLPCLIFAAADIKEEAQGFLLANCVRGAVQSIDKYRALLVAEDPTATAIRDMIASTGHVIQNSSGSGHVRCVAFLMRAHHLSSDTLRSMWPIIVRVSNGGQVTDEVVKAFFATERILQRTEQGSLLDKHNRDVINKLAIDQLLASIQKAKAYFGGGEKSCARGLIDCLNYRRTSKRIAIDIDQE